ncbi:PTS fructose transporter subunit IIA [Inmirania thermothiophila]|uniref:PTS system ascorbate-specific IIA component n=1 Tax=Inmirania thermothiophila TaxID=1750597 RepID=A0A3N1XSY4_9GAMM|nr:PTS fructose transporter subunit IIA [Inmirania thermothiophila]ROR29753.1 PTS system ascorbate-specific IIA component [Inmirania thermothiophila]
MTARPPVGLLLVTHGAVGGALLAAARGILGETRMPLEVVASEPGGRPEALAAAIEAALDRLDRGAGVLVLTDLHGATPANLVARAARGRRVRSVSGINLPMLLRVLNYADRDLAELARRAAEGAAAGIVASEQGEPE